MKLPCSVVEDLLPLYHDGVCGDESSALVAEHLQDCPHCQELLTKLKDAATTPAPHIDAAAPMKSIRDAWTKGRKKSFLKGTVLAVVLCAVLAGAYYGLTRWKCIPVPAEVLEVTEVSRLADGRIIYHLNVKDDKNLYFIKFTTRADGSYYMTPMRSIIESRRTMDTGLFNDYFMVDIEENNAYQQTYGQGIEITSCYIGPEDDGILIWDESMTLPAASPALEELVQG